LYLSISVIYGETTQHRAANRQTPSKEPRKKPRIRVPATKKLIKTQLLQKKHQTEYRNGKNRDLMVISHHKKGTNIKAKRT